MTAVRYVGDAATSASATIPRVLAERAELSPDARFVSCDGQAITFAEALLRARQAAAALADAGVRAGDKLAVMLPNGLEFLDLWFGSALLGAVLVPVNTGLVGEGLAHVLRHSESTLLVADGTLAAACDAALGNDGPPLRRFALSVADRPAASGQGSATIGGGSGVTSAPDAAGWGDGRAWLAGAYAPAPEATVRPDGLASILYTSGTTGRAKGVMNGHQAFVTTGLGFAREMVRMRDDDVLYTSLPLFHVNAQMLSTMGALVSGRPLVLARRFSASSFLDDVRRERATIFNYIGAMLTMIAKQPARADDHESALRLAVGGAAPADLWPTFERRFGLSILEAYGLTETATACASNPPDDVRVGTIGRAVSWAEIRIEDERGEPAPDDQPGEIVVRATRPDVLFQGYFRDPEATRKAMAGGWFHTGDRGRRDADGYLTFLDRLKDVIRRRGENISSFEVERAVNAHDAVAESAAVGVPSDLGEEDVLIVVVLRPGATVSGPELLQHCATRLAPFMLPRYVRIVPTLPKTATQRVQKFQLRAEGVAPDAWDRERAGDPDARNDERPAKKRGVRSGGGSGGS